MNTTTNDENRTEDTICNISEITRDYKDTKVDNNNDSIVFKAIESFKNYTKTIEHKYSITDEYDKAHSIRKCDVYGYVYKITNDINGHFYIGQSKNSLWDRFYRHIIDSIGTRHLTTHFAKAIRKYGYEHFHIEPIDHAFTKDELTHKESFWIRTLNSTNCKIGYNETYAEDRSGGNTYISKSETELNEIKAKISENTKGSNNRNSSRVKCRNVNTGEELHFDCIKKAQLYFNERQHITISRRCSHKIKSLYRNEWEFSYEDRDYSDKSLVLSNRFKTSKRRILFEMIETGEVKEFCSYRAAEKYYNLPFRTIKSKHAKRSGDVFIIQGKYKITVIS